MIWVSRCFIPPTRSEFGCLCQRERNKKMFWSLNLQFWFWGNRTLWALCLVSPSQHLVKHFQARLVITWPGWTFSITWFKSSSEASTRPAPPRTSSACDTWKRFTDIWEEIKDGTDVYVTQILQQESPETQSEAGLQLDPDGSGQTEILYKQLQRQNELLFHRPLGSIDSVDQ